MEKVRQQILVSAGESSGDRYAAGVVRALQGMMPGFEYFGCAGVEMRSAGVDPIVRAESLSVVGIVEVIHHIPRIYGEFQKLVRAAKERRPAAAILTDSPDFHLRLAAKLRAERIPVYYLVAPQLWAWREGRVRLLRRNVKELHCIFPFEEKWFRDRGVDTHYIGHPLTRLVRAEGTREEFLFRHGMAQGPPLVTLCPGSRKGEVRRHLAVLRDAANGLKERFGANLVLAAPKSAQGEEGWDFLDEWCSGCGVTRVDGETWDAMMHSDLTLAASGTVTVEAALLGTPMVTFYKVSSLTWWIGRPLVSVPFYSMVNIVAQRRIVPELIQDGMTAAALLDEAGKLLSNADARAAMKAELAQVRAALATGRDPLETSARRIAAASGVSGLLEKERVE